MENPWRERKQPYRENAFQILKITPDTVERRTIKRAREKVEIIVKCKGGNLSSVRKAGEIIDDPMRRFVEELLEHRVHRPDKQSLEQCLKEFKEGPIHPHTLSEKLKVTNLGAFLDVLRPAAVSVREEATFTTDVKIKMERDISEEIVFDR